MDYDKYSDKAFVNRKLKPFNLQEALAGKPVVTREGKPARDFHVFTGVVEYQRVFAVVGGEVMSFNEEGRFWNSGANACHDLFMASEKKEGWVNVYRSNGMDQAERYRGYGVHSSEQKARELASFTGFAKEYIASVRIEWEE